MLKGLGSFSKGVVRFTTGSQSAEHGLQGKRQHHGSLCPLSVGGYRSSKVFGRWYAATELQGGRLGEEAGELVNPVRGDHISMGSYDGPLLHCVNPEMGQKILEELHERVCSLHIGERALAVAAI